MPENPYRLPRKVVPRRYDIRLEPDLARHTFRGQESIEVEIREPVEELTLNAVEIDVTRALLHASGGTFAARAEHDEVLQRVTLRLAAPVEPGEAVLELDFEGVLNDQLHGFYRSTFKDVEGVERTIATTQFEATDARRAFPCWDEPDLKAVFGITLVVPDDLLAVSNAQELRREAAGPGRVAVTFADTIPMSTYLVAFVVGPFTATDPVDVDGVPLRVVVPRGKEHLTRFALTCGAFCIRYLRDYYDIPYPGDKVDMVAIPDFAFGAMENLGCITFRETALLVDEETATQAELVRILDVVAHELAHMWFGDLVTMRWWDGIWLNEAFATFMEMKATDAMRPEWKRWLAFGAVERPWAFAVDALQATRPVEFEVTSPEECNEMFDALTYGKGSSILRMMEQYLGEETFRRGVGDYLRGHAFGNTVTADLWQALDGASGEPVGEIMDTWLLQGGHPRLEVEQTEGGIRIAQRRFLAIPDETDRTRWKVPVAVRGESGGLPFVRKVLLDGEDVTLPLEGPVDWVVANAGGHGFYRVSYSEPLAKSLLGSMDLLDDLERFCLVDDAWAFVEAGGTTAPAYLELASAYRHEQEQAVWTSLLGGLSAVRHHLVSDDDLPPFRRLVGGLLAPTMERLGWEPRPGEGDLSRRLRGQILGAAGRLADDPGVVDRARRVAAGWLEDLRGVDPDVAQASLFTWAAHGTHREYDRIFQAYRESDTPQTQLKLLQALTLFDDPAAVDRTIEAILSGSIRSQDSSWVVARLFGGRHSGPHAWRQVRDRWSEVIATMPPMTLRRMVEGIPSLSRPETALEVEAFFADTEVPAAAKAVKQSLERLRANTLLRERESLRLSEFLRQQPATGAPPGEG